ncbi:MAG: hypothetical protein ACE5I1_25040 [bacterium]
MNHSTNIQSGFMQKANFFLLIITLLSYSCSQNSTESNLAPTAVIEKDRRFFILDETGKEWEITHAVKKYGMQPYEFQFGLGPFAIRPVLQPQLLSPGDENYPPNNAEFLILGSTLNGESRAYSIDKLSDNEIVDEQFGEAHVAVAY